MSLFLSRFRGLLEECGKPQKEICADLGIRNQKLSNWKTGYSEPNFDDLVMLANYFDISTDYLLGVTEEDDFGNITIKKEKSAEISPDGKELLEIFNDLPAEYQAQILEYARYFETRNVVSKRKNKNGA